jgi:hypothetical protein
MTHELRSRHIGHRAPFGLGDRKQRPRRDVAQIGAKGELEAATNSDAVDRGDHGDRQLAPQPDDMLSIIGYAVRSLGQIGEGQEAAALSYGTDPLDVETGAKGAPFPGQHHCPQALIILEPRADLGDRLEHCRIEGVHLARAIEPDISDAVRDRQSDAIFHGTVSLFLLLRTLPASRL